MEVSQEHLHKCYKEIRDWTGYKNIVKTWELCENCIDRLEAAMRKEADRIDNSRIARRLCGANREAIDSLEVGELP
jgi:hypothetical protein